MSEHSRHSKLEKCTKTCSICLCVIRKKGKIDSCEHPFCFQCIQQWSQIENTCPVCKRRFKEIKEGSIGKLSSSHSRNKKVKVAKISNKNQEDRSYEMFLEDFEGDFIQNMPEEYVFLNHLIFQGIQGMPFSETLDDQDIPAQSASP